MQAVTAYGELKFFGGAEEATTEILEDIRKNGFNGCVECAQCL